MLNNIPIHFDLHFDLSTIKEKKTRDNLVVQFIQETYPTIMVLYPCNTYSYKLSIDGRKKHLMLYTSTLKFYDDIKGKVLHFTTLKDFDKLLQEYIPHG